MVGLCAAADRCLEWAILKRMNLRKRDFHHLFPLLFKFHHLLGQPMVGCGNLALGIVSENALWAGCHGQHNTANFQLGIDLPLHPADGFEQLFHAFRRKVRCLH